MIKEIKEVTCNTVTCLIVAPKKAKKAVSNSTPNTLGDDDGSEIDLTNIDDTESTGSSMSSSSSLSSNSDNDDNDDNDDSILELPLPSVSICLQWSLNGAQLTGSRRRVISLDQSLASFEEELSNLSNPKLSGRKWMDDGILIYHEWAWLTKTQSMGKCLQYSPLEDMGDWNALCMEVRKSKARAGDMIMMMFARIEIPEDIIENKSGDDGTSQRNSRKVCLSFD